MRLPICPECPVAVVILAVGAAAILNAGRTVVDRGDRFEAFIDLIVGELAVDVLAPAVRFAGGIDRPA